jgi:hypothetical protein
MNMWDQLRNGPGTIGGGITANHIIPQPQPQPVLPPGGMPSPGVMPPRQGLGMWNGSTDVGNKQGRGGQMLQPQPQPQPQPMPQPMGGNARGNEALIQALRK